MMGSYQVVILKEAQQLRGIERLSLYTQKPSPTTILVICHKEKNVDKRSAFYKGCAANGAVLESVRPRDYEIASWLQQFIRERGLTIDAKRCRCSPTTSAPTSRRSRTNCTNSRSRCPRHDPHHRCGHRGQHRYLEGFQQLRALQGRRYTRHGPGADDRRPLRP